jgi:hypothetical protein
VRKEQYSSFKRLMWLAGAGLTFLLPLSPVGRRGGHRHTWKHEVTSGTDVLPNI